jgi:hypothetical protein
MQTPRPIPRHRPRLTRHSIPYLRSIRLGLAIRNHSCSDRSVHCRMSRSFPRCRSRRSSGFGCWCLFVAGRRSLRQFQRPSCCRAHWRYWCSPVGYSWWRLSARFVLARLGPLRPAAPRPARPTRQISSWAHSLCSGLAAIVYDVSSTLLVSGLFEAGCRKARADLFQKTRRRLERLFFETCRVADMIMFPSTI